MTATGADWTATQRAEHLHRERDRLIARLPGIHAAARGITADERELVVDEAIEYVALGYAKPIRTAEELERVLWTACGHRVLDAARGRGRTVRSGYQRADASTLGELADDQLPEAIVEQAAERDLAAEFAASLTTAEGRVYRVKFLSDTSDPVGYRKVAQRLRIPSARARALERSIARKLEDFASTLAAGQLCEQRAALLASTVTGHASEMQARIARAHIKHCAACKLAYTAQLRDLRSAEFARKVASLLPAPVAAEAADRQRNARELLTDWIARLLGHGDAPATAAQLAAGGAGRGAGTVIAIKLGACLAGGAATIGACVATGLVALPAPVHRDPAERSAATARPTRTPFAHVSSVRTPYPTATPRPTATPTPKPRPTTRRTASTRTQGGTSATSHEQTPASPAPAGSLPNGGSEFVPSNATESAAPAPAPAAPGASEFGP